MDSKEIEQTLVLIKPDALKNSLTGYVLSQLSEFHTGLRFAGMKVVQVSDVLAEEHYAEHRGKPFFRALIEYITGISHYPSEAWKRRVIAIVFMGPDAVRKIREIAGPTNPTLARETKPGTVRALGSVIPVEDENGKMIGQRMDNLIHASASMAEGEREIKMWFKPNDLPPGMRTFPVAESNEHYYCKNRKLYTTHESDSICLFAPGDVVWKSDLETLEQIYKGEKTTCTLESVAAKYLINDSRDVA